MSDIHNRFNQYSDEQLVQLAADTQKMAHDAPKNLLRNADGSSSVGNSDAWSRHSAEWRATCAEIHRRGIQLGKGWTIIPSPLPPDPVGEGGKHTPSPWRADGCEIIGDSRVVATVHWCSGMEIEDQANLDLIEAASDMLAALIKLSNEVLGTLPLMETLARREFGNTNYNILIQRADEARALIIQVQGQTP